MIDLSTPNEWQHIDPETGLLFPWYTKSFLDELATWDLKDKVVFEIGMGASTLWWNNRSAGGVAIDTYRSWYYATVEKLEGGNFTCMLPKPGGLLNAIEMHFHKREFDIIVIDCEPVAFRDGCVPLVLPLIKPGGTLIIDNWDQPSVWGPSDETRVLLASYEMKVYKQEGHPDWQTAIFKIA